MKKERKKTWVLRFYKDPTDGSNAKMQMEGCQRSDLKEPPVIHRWSNNRGAVVAVVEATEWQGLLKFVRSGHTIDWSRAGGTWEVVNSSIPELVGLQISSKSEFLDTAINKGLLDHGHVEGKFNFAKYSSRVSVTFA